MRRNALPAGLMAAALSLALAGCPGGRQAPRATTATPSAATAATAGNRLNVLLVTIDTLRADHLGLYGYRRATSPHLDALAQRATVFDQAYTYWPKTRGSFVAILTGRLASQTGYSKGRQELLDWNPTLASTLKQAGYRTEATVDNPNVAKALGYAKGFDRYRETWLERTLPTEVDRMRAITADGVSALREAKPGQPFFLWLHYVNPHAPYQPPPPFDTAFLDTGAARGPVLGAVKDFHGGAHAPWAKAGKPLGWYVAQYDGEIATVDAQIGSLVDALSASLVRDRTLLVVTSDHGESLGEHDYYFDHGEDLFDPCVRIPLLIAGPGVKGGSRSNVLASTLDLVPTVLDAVKVSYPPDLAGLSLLPATRGEDRPQRPRLPGQNDRSLLGAWDQRYKIVATPQGDGARYALYDRQRDPGETRDASRSEPDRFRQERSELELFRDRFDAQMAKALRLLQGLPEPAKLDAPSCERLKSLGYALPAGCS